MKWATWIAALTVMGSAVVATIMFVNRLSDREVALIVGAICGVGVGVPLGMVLGATFAGQRRRDKDIHLPPTPPSVVYVTPPATANRPLGASYPIGPVNSPALPRRSYNVIGGNGGEDDGEIYDRSPDPGRTGF